MTAKTMQVTQKSAVNTWECDENAHMNVQFYWKRFDNAGQVLANSAKKQFRRWTDRHVRYHRELMSGAITTVNSTELDGGETVLHLMTGAGAEALSATAVDRFSASSVALNELADLPDAARPRSVSSRALEPQDAETMIRNAHGLVSHLSVIIPGECDSEGILLDQFHISRFSEAASHFWDHLGLNVGAMLEQNLGSVAVEMKVTRHALPKVDMITEVVSWLEEVREKTFTFRHQVRDVRSDVILYSGAVTALMIDLAKRKTVPLPDSIRRLV